ncbi:uncharacterized protein [Gossypium hirsutum]|uniref:Retrotransposon gag domain-containing protein n=1 Tax=Gossypium hirsutum TaxID=3635 RepID=A0A1U8N3C9_GOSHI|nr:uncharacterized protein LOC107944285 [Gossypium hirsutum]
MDVELNERMERMERTQRELQEQLAKSRQEARDLMVRARNVCIELWSYPSDLIVPDLDDPAEIARLKVDDNNAQDKFRILEERIKAVEGAEVFSALSAKELSLVLDLILPPKFKALDFEKYDGTRCPKAHLIMFCRKMTGYVSDDKLLVHCFQDSLVGSALRWYNQLSRENPIMEGFGVIILWRDISAQVEPPLTKTEITVIFINTLKAPFYEKLVGSAIKDFTDIVITEELIENVVKSGRMESPESSKRTVPAKKKEAEAHMVRTKSQCTPNPYPAQSRPHYRPPSNFYFPPQCPYYQAPPSYPIYAMNNQRPLTVFPPNTMPTQSQLKNEQRPARPNSEIPQFTPIPVSYGELYPKLLEKQLISPHYMAPLKPPYPKCVSNVTGNPLPNHTGENVNAVTNEDNWQAKGYVAEVRTPLRKVWEMMIENGLLCPPSKILKEEEKKDQSFCDFHGIKGHDIQSYKEFRKLLQDMMDNKEVKVFDSVEGAEEGEICASDNQSMVLPYSVDRPLVIYYEAKKEEVSREVKPSLIIEVPAPFSYKDNKAVP